VTDVTVEERIGRPRDDVAAYASDWRNDSDWIGALSEVNLVTDGPFGVGSRVQRVAAFLGRRIEYVNEVVAWDPDERLRMKSVKAPFPMTVTYEWEDAGKDGTLMRIRAEGDASGFYRFAGPLLSLMVRRGIASDLKRLRANLESGG
jgi:uncharacterized membrane protein